jgi:hypothetical protein
MTGRTPADRFWPKVDQHGPDGFHSQTGVDLGPCWLWTAPPNSDGYGRLKVDGQEVKAHVFAYELLIGPVPSGLQPDHLCRVRLCVRPDHLEPVTCRVNLLRGDTHAARNAAKTHCLAGHAFSAENTYIYRGKRYCRACQRSRGVAYLARKRGKHVPQLHGPPGGLGVSKRKRQPLYPLIDRLLPGGLEARLRRQRAEGLSFEDMAKSLHVEETIVVSGELVRKWCDDLAITSDSTTAGAA